MPEHTKTPPEPSMEEIIASISRIITEEKRPPEPVNPVSASETDILELTEVVDEDGSVRQVTSSAGNAASSSESGSSDNVSAGVKPALTNASERNEPGPGPADAGVEERLQAGRERILSSAKSGAAAAAFAQLGILPRERRRENELRLGAAGRTLEDVVRDLLRPLLQAWLDEHLPEVVERLVREEIARVVGEAGLR